LDLLVAGTESSVNMLEANANEVGEDIVVEALKIAQKEVALICKFQKEIIKAIGKEKESVSLKEISEDFISEVKKLSYDRLGEILFSSESKEEKTSRTKSLIAEVYETLKDEFEEDVKCLNLIIDEITNEVVHLKAVNEGLRPDNRGVEEIRPLDVMVDLLPRVHGSGLFARGLTQVLSVLTLASPSESLVQQGMEEAGEKRYMHHYNFPSFSVGETGRARGLNRREIGHGALAEKALKPMIPNVDEFPYAIRVVSEVLSSNGSSSMASVCGSSLCLMAGGVPIKEPVAGIAMGLMSHKDKKVILTDIQGAEDHFGDMDFKVAGTKNGITALQMDVKIEGATPELLHEIMIRAKKARLEILDKMLSVISEPRKELSKYAPKISCLVVDIDKVGEIIGSGGKTIKAIIEKTGVEINIEDNKVYFISDDLEAVEKAQEIVLGIVKEYEVNEVIQGKIIELKPFGAIVEFGNKTGLLHISEISNKRIENINDVLKVGDNVTAKIKKMDDGKIALSAKDIKKD
jgi:polyribonucleotide nucleotidyltransferase